MSKDANKNNSHESAGLDIVAPQELSKGLTRSAQIMGLFMCFIFIVLYGLAIYQLDFWRNYFFSDSKDISESCLYHNKITPTIEFAEDLNKGPLKPIRLPHREQALFNDLPKKGDYYQIYYKCSFSLEEDLLKQPQIIYIHLGWLYGDRVRVILNGHERLVTYMEDKGVIALNEQDRKHPEQVLEIYAVRYKNARVGVAGGTPVVVAEGTSKNFKINGIEVALQNIKPLFRLIPVTILGLVLFIAWLLGIRNQLVVAALFYFVMTAISDFLIYSSSIFPWSVIATSLVSWWFLYAGIIAYMIFGMVLLNFNSRLVTQFYLIIFAIMIFVFLPSIFIWGDYPDFLRTADIIMQVIFGINGVVLFHRYIQQRQHIKNHTVLLIYKIFIWVTWIFLLLQVIEIIAARFGWYFFISGQMQVIMPLFVAGILFYYLASIQRIYEKEKERRQRIEARLELGRTVQELLLPKSLSGNFGSTRFHFFYNPAEEMAGDWLQIWDFSDEEKRLIIGDVVGKGPQAALAVSAIASSIHEAKEKKLSMDECIKNINSMLIDLFHKRISTTLSAAVVHKNGYVELYNCGSVGWFTKNKDQVNYFPLRGRQLGVHQDIKIEKTTLTATPGSVLFTFTDGCLEGSRALKALMRELKVQDLGESSESTLCQLVLKVGEETVLEDDRTLLVVAA